MLFFFSILRQNAHGLESVYAYVQCLRIRIITNGGDDDEIICACTKAMLF